MTLRLSVFMPKEATAALLKEAEAVQPMSGAEPIESPWKHGLGVVGAGAAGFVGGGLAGALTGKLLDKGFGAATGNKVPLQYIQRGLPLAGAALGIAGKLYYDHQQEELSRALQAHKDQRQRGLSSK